MAKKKEKWIKSAIKKPGALTQQAERAGKTVDAFATDVLKPGSKASVTTKRRASLAKTLAGLQKHKKKGGA